MRRYYNSYMDEISLLKILLVIILFEEYYRYFKNIFYKLSNKNKRTQKQKGSTKVKKRTEKHMENNLQSNKEKLVNLNNKKNEEKTEDIKITIDNEVAAANAKLNMKKEITSKVPIVISEKSFCIPLEQTIKLDEYSSEIKRVTSDIYLSENKLLPLQLSDGKINYKRGKLFIKGIVKNNIEYTTIENIKDNSYTGYIKYINVFMPFKCTTFIDYNLPPNFNYKKEHSPNDSVKCSIKEAEIFGTNKCDNIKSLEKGFKYGKLFNTIYQKVVLKIAVSLTQNQIVKFVIPGYS
ncbi:DUF7852 domain-containing protein [Clostridium sp. JNZ J1-5]|nr:hypothetical protein [Clostridium sp.]